MFVEKKDLSILSSRLIPDKFIGTTFEKIVKSAIGEYGLSKQHNMIDSWMNRIDPLLIDPFKKKIVTVLEDIDFTEKDYIETNILRKYLPFEIKQENIVKKSDWWEGNIESNVLDNNKFFYGTPFGKVCVTQTNNVSSVNATETFDFIYDAKKEIINSLYEPINTNKTFRVSVYMKQSKLSDPLQNKIFFGYGMSLETGVNTHENTITSLWEGNLPKENTWYLIVGFITIVEQSSLENEQEDILFRTNLAGLYEVDSGLKVQTGDGVNSVLIQDNQYTDNSINVRTHYNYNIKNTANSMITWHPRLEIVDGTELPIDALLDTSEYLRDSGRNMEYNPTFEFMNNYDKHINIYRVQSNGIEVREKIKYKDYIIQHQYNRVYLEAGAVKVGDKLELSSISDEFIRYLRHYIPMIGPLLNLDIDIARFNAHDLVKIGKDISKYKGLKEVYYFLNSIIVDNSGDELHLTVDKEDNMIAGVRELYIENIQNKSNEPWYILGDNPTQEEKVFIGTSLPYSKEYKINNVLSIIDIDGDAIKVGSDLNANNNITPFIYSVKGSVNKETFNRYLKPINHPLGFGINYELYSILELIDEDKKVTEQVNWVISEKVYDVLNKMEEDILKFIVIKNVYLNEEINPLASGVNTNYDTFERSLTVIGERQTITLPGSTDVYTSRSTLIGDENFKISENIVLNNNSKYSDSFTLTVQ